MSFFLFFLLLFLAAFCSTQAPDFEKVSAYECGFQPFHDSRIPFNAHYYKVALLFVIFDLELIFLMPWVFSASVVGLLGFLFVFFFLFILIFGYYFEWEQGILDWL